MTNAWYWRSLPLENRTGSEVFNTLFRSTAVPGIATLLESPYPTPTDHPQLSRYSICAGAPRTIDGIVQMWTPPLGQVLPFLENLLQNSQQIISPSSPSSPSSPPPPLPFIGGWLGWLGYDIAYEIEQLPREKIDPLPFPVAFWYEPDCFAILDHGQQLLWLAASDVGGLDELQKKLVEGHGEGGTQGRGELNTVRGFSGSDNWRFHNGDTKNNFPAFPYGFAVACKGKPGHSAVSPRPRVPVSSPSPHLCISQADYESAVNQAKKYIQAGDIFQANLSLRFQASTAASGWEIYQTLQKINPSPFACYWQTPWGEVISCSPERLVMLENRQAQTRPIAGTRSRGATPEQDQQLAQDLLSNTKERAEHIMLVDLERNDLGRVCEWGSVRVDELLSIERYSHVMHLVSNIQGTLRSDRTPIDLIRATFPGGTITGCPKVRCMEIIEQLEPLRRSLFYGSCGYLDWRGNLDLNILIRTLLLTPSSQIEDNTGTQGQGDTEDFCASSPSFPFHTVWGQVGAGIVADSDPEREWYESLHKAQAQLVALKMLDNQ